MPEKPRKDPTQGRAKATVDAILEAAAQILEREESAEPPRDKRTRPVNTTRIAERAGVSIGSLYQYFPNRDALVSSLMRRFVRRRFVDIELAVADVEAMPLEAGLRVLAGRLIELELAEGRIMRVLMKWFARVGDYDLIAEGDREAEAALAAILRRIAHKTRPLDPALGGFFLYHAMRNLLGMACYREPEMLRSDAARDELTRLMYGYLRPDG